VDVIRAQEADSGLALTELRVDGGAAADDLLLQIQADLLGVPVVRPKVTETTALGAAYLAGLAVGYWKSVEAISSQWAVDRRFEPKVSKDEATARMNDWHRAVERSRGWVQTE
jgi:glycerol kinase